MKKKIICLLLAAALCLSACGREKSATTPQEAGGAAAPALAARPANLSGEARRMASETLPMPETGINLFDAVRTPTGAFLYGVDENQQPHYFTLDTESLEIKALPELRLGTREAFCASPDGTLRVLYLTEEGRFCLLSRSPDGTCEEVLLPDELLNGEPVASFEAAEDALYVTTPTRAFSFDAGGKLLQDYGTAQNPRNFLRLGSGQLLLISYGNSGNNRPGAVSNAEIQEIGADGAPGERYPVESMFTFYLAGSDGQLLVQQNDIYYRYDYKTGNGEALINGFTSGIRNTGLVCLGEDLFFSVDQGKPLVWRPWEGGEVQILTLATYDIDFGLKKDIEAFNESNGDYMIQLVDYADFDTYEDQNTGLNKLATDIISGNAPDIYDMSRFSVNQYAAKGLLEDLKPYFEEDPDLDYSELVPNVVQAMEFHGGLYQLVPGFELVAVAGDRSTIGPDWGAERFLDLTRELPYESIFGLDLTRDTFMSHVLAFMHRDLYSEEELWCDFQNQDFMELLSFAASLPASFNYDGSQGTDLGRAYDGEQVLVLTSLDASVVDQVSFMDAIFSGEAQFVGFPAAAGSGFGFRPTAQLAMSSAGHNKFGVWEFFRYLLSDELLDQGFYGLPLRTAALERRLDRNIASAMEKPTTLNTASTIGWVSFEGAPVDESMRERIHAMVDQIDCCTVCDSTILSIVMEQAEPFFAGGKTVEDAAAGIQSRVKIYLSEQYG